jgi:hypothetical protein
LVGKSTAKQFSSGIIKGKWVMYYNEFEIGQSYLIWI